MMKRREFIGLFGGMAAAWSLAAHAQNSATMETQPILIFRMRQGSGGGSKRLN